MSDPTIEALARVLANACWGEGSQETRHYYRHQAHLALAWCRQNDPTLTKVRERLVFLSTYGDEDWKTPGHVMNAWVSKATVQYKAKQALAALDAAREVPDE